MENRVILPDSFVSFQPLMSTRAEFSHHHWASARMTLGRHLTGSKINLETVGLSVMVFCAATSFLIGFFLGEDSIGGARFDFYLFHWPAIELFSSTSWGIAVADYGGAANNPLLYAIAS